MANRTKVTDEFKKKFLRLLEENGGIISHAARDLNTPRTTLYSHRAADAEFAKEWDEAVDRGIDVLEDEARERALNGTEEPVFYQGEICGHVHRKSDSLMALLLRAYRPKFKDRHEFTGADGQPLSNVIIYLPENHRDDEEAGDD